jgi:hypothetical protein
LSNHPMSWVTDGPSNAALRQRCLGGSRAVENDLLQDR